MKSWRGRFGALVAALALCAPGFGIASYGHASAAPTSEPSRRVFASSVCAPPHCAFHGSTQSLSFGATSREYFGSSLVAANGGYWLAASNGRVFNFGDAQTYGSLAGRDAYFGDVVAMAATPDGKGYWLAASNGRVFNFGDAQSYGSGESSALRPHGTRIVGIAVTPDGKGYWLASANAAVATYGDASSYGLGTRPGLSKSVVSIAATPGGSGYWLAATDGAVFNLSGAPFDGSVPGMGARVGGIVAIVPAVGRLPITPPTTPTLNSLAGDSYGPDTMYWAYARFESISGTPNAPSSAPSSSATSAISVMPGTMISARRGPMPVILRRAARLLSASFQ